MARYVCARSTCTPRVALARAHRSEVLPAAAVALVSPDAMTGAHRQWCAVLSARAPTGGFELDATSTDG